MTGTSNLLTLSLLTFFPFPSLPLLSLSLIRFFKVKNILFFWSLLRIIKTVTSLARLVTMSLLCILHYMHASASATYMSIPSFMPLARITPRHFVTNNIRTEIRLSTLGLHFLPKISGLHDILSRKKIMDS